MNNTVADVNRQTAVGVLEIHGNALSIDLVIARGSGTLYDNDVFIDDSQTILKKPRSTLIEKALPFEISCYFSAYLDFSQIEQMMPIYLKVKGQEIYRDVHPYLISSSQKLAGDDHLLGTFKFFPLWPRATEVRATDQASYSLAAKL